MYIVIDIIFKQRYKTANFPRRTRKKRGDAKTKRPTKRTAKRRGIVVVDTMNDDENARAPTSGEEVSSSIVFS